MGACSSGPPMKLARSSTGWWRPQTTLSSSERFCWKLMVRSPLNLGPAVKTQISFVEPCHEDGCSCGPRTHCATNRSLPNACEWLFSLDGHCFEERSHCTGLLAVGEGF